MKTTEATGQEKLGGFQIHSAANLMGAASSCLIQTNDPSSSQSQGSVSDRKMADGWMTGSIVNEIWSLHFDSNPEE